MPTQLKPILRRFYLFRFIHSLNFFSAVLIPFYIHWGGQTQTVAFWLQAWFAIWQVIFELPTGYIADRFGRRTSMTLGSLASVVGFTVYAIMPSLPLFILAELILALSMALVSGADEAWLYETLKQYGRQDLMQTVHTRTHGLAMTGGAIGALIGGLIGQYLGLNFPMFFSALASLFAAGILLTLSEPVNSKQSVRKEAKQHITDSLKFFASSHQMKLLTFNLVVLAVVAFFTIWLYQPLLLELTDAYGLFGVFHAFLMATEAVVLFSLPLIRKFVHSLAGLMRLTAVLTALGFLIVAVWLNYTTVVLFLILSGGFGLTRLEFAKGHLHDLVPSDQQRATIGSSLAFMKRLLIVPFDLSIGLVIAFSLDYTLFALAAIAAVVALLPFPEQTSNQS